MKIVIAGNWRWPQYETAFAAGLRELGHEVLPFSTSAFFNGFLGQQQLALPVPGPALLRLNRALLSFLNDGKPDLLLAWRCTHVLPSTIKAVNAMGVLSVSYNNDDPFGPAAHGNVPWHHKILWHWYLRGIRHYRRNFFYRKVNVAEAKQRGAEHADVLMPYFIPWQDRPLALTKDETNRYGCDVAFAGHYEPDGREKYLRALAQSGLSVKLYGGSYWTPEVLGDLNAGFFPVLSVRGDDYVKALCGAKVCIAFLSKLNRDTYTRRCFEIPACGRVMLAERTDDLLRMFAEDKEACFFSSTEELVAKAKWLVGNPAIVGQIAQAGLRRVWTDRHDVRSRAAWFLNSLAEQKHVEQGLVRPISCASGGVES